MKRPVWRKISTWCNKRSFIQKYKIKRTSKYEMIHCIRVFSTIPRTYVSWFAFSIARSKSPWIMKFYILNISNWALCLSHISNFQARNHCCTVLSIFLFLWLFYFQFSNTWSLRSWEPWFFGPFLIIIISAYFFGQK